MSVSVGGRNTTQYEDDGIPPYGMSKTERLQKLVHQMTFPVSYTSNSAKEQLCLEFVEHFRTQYVQLFPTRPPLMLSPDNECGVKKFLCTFARPTELPYEELYDYNTCARYIANYITYKQLEEPEKLPRVVVSPTTTLAWQVGDCLDMSLVLLSLLLGNGYDAYGVIGYATYDVTVNDQRGRKCPEVVPDEASEGQASEQTSERVTKYSLRKRPDLESKFQKDLENKRLTELDGRVRQQEEDGENQEDGEDDELHGKRIHCWILVQYGKRDIQSNFFIEPSTGSIVPIENSPSYLAIESLFNHNNYWVNMQETKKPSELSFDLKDLSKWEYIFLMDNEVDEEDNDGQERKRLEDFTSDHGESGDQILDMPASWVRCLTMTRQQFENGYPGLRKTVEYKDAAVELFAAYSESDCKVKRITFADELGMHDQVHTFFQFRIDKLRRRSEYAASDGHNHKIHEWFDEGRKREVMEALRENILEEGIRREMRFYWKARLDGLANRTELFHDGDASTPKKVMEFFQGRGDRLVYRSATYDPQGVVGVTISVPTGPAAARASDDNKPNPRKMTEKFDRNTAIPADTDVAKRTFYNPGTPENQIRIIYHYADGKITRPSRIYSRGSPVVIEHVDPFAKDPKPAVLLEEMRMLYVKEKECLAHIKESEKEAKDILSQRAKEVGNVESVTTVYDTLRNKPKEDEQAEMRRKMEEQQRANQKKDFLLPYIEQHVRQHHPPHLLLRGDQPVPSDLKLTKEDAQKVKDSCLAELKSRLIARAHIMQNRLDDEKEKLARRQSTFQKNVEQMDNPKEHEEYIQFCEDAMWRIHILEKRLERHQEESLQKYAEMDRKLKEDVRLAALHT